MKQYLVTEAELKFELGVGLAKREALHPLPPPGARVLTREQVGSALYELYNADNHKCHDIDNILDELFGEVKVEQD